MIYEKGNEKLASQQHCFGFGGGCLVGGSSVQAANTYDMTQGEFLTNGLNYTTTTT